MTIKCFNNGSQHILYCQPCEDSPRSSEQSAFNAELFDPDYLKNHQLIYRTAQGRGDSYFFRYQQQQWVLRHYWRGGWMARFNRDAYLWQRLQNTRAFRELALLQKIQQWQLPAPEPIAARIFYRMGFYRADIITGAIDCSQSLAMALKHTLSVRQWQTIGRTIREFHQRGIYHDDLNAHNILLNNQGLVFLIDFDKGKILPTRGAGSWTQKNLMRLLRSLRKEKNNNPSLGFSEKNWVELMRAYNSQID